MNEKKPKKKLKSFDIAALNLPNSPGVYLMKNSQEEIIYIGKAKNLKKRVRSYFTGSKDIKTCHLQSRISSLDTIVTGSEVEALLLENNLIKRWKPKYNINLKDGKTYPVIKLTDEEYPRVYRTRRIVFDGSRYFGPFPNVGQVDIYLNLINKLFPLRKCRGKLKYRSHPCLNYHIRRCPAPCCGKIDHKEYMKLTDKIRLLLSGKIKKIIRELTEKMEKASASLEYEKAGFIANQIAAIHTMYQDQQVVDFRQEARDYIGFCSRGSSVCLIILQMRSGKLVGRDSFMIQDYSQKEDMLITFLAQYYGGKNSLPKVLYLSPESFSTLDTDITSDFLFKLVGEKIGIVFPKKGKHARLIRMAEESSKQKMDACCNKHITGLKNLQEVLNLSDPPQRIEGFDIAHLEGRHTVASMVSFFEGEPDKGSYRHYTIKSTKNRIDDFKAIREVVARRYTRLLNENKKMPDLILIDGGKGQVSSTMAVLKAISLPDMPVVGLAKKNEEIFVPDKKDPIVLPESSEALKVLQAVRDEAHRFANTYHKKIRGRLMNTSLLEQVEGIGKKRSRRLLEQFGSIQEIKRKKPEEIAKTAGLSFKKAQAVIEYINKTIRGDYNAGNSSRRS